MPAPTTTSQSRFTSRKCWRASARCCAARRAMPRANLTCGSVRLDTRTGRVSVDGNPIKLTSHEYRLLAYLMHHTRPGRLAHRTGRASLRSGLRPRLQHHRGVRRARPQEARRRHHPDRARPRLPADGAERSGVARFAPAVRARLRGDGQRTSQGKGHQLARDAAVHVGRGMGGGDPDSHRLCAVVGVSAGGRAVLRPAPQSLSAHADCRSGAAAGRRRRQDLAGAWRTAVRAAAVGVVLADHAARTRESRKYAHRARCGTASCRSSKSRASS